MKPHTTKKNSATPICREDDEVKILEGLKAVVVAIHDDQVVVETEDGRPKWIDRRSLQFVSSQDEERKSIWAEISEAA